MLRQRVVCLVLALLCVTAAVMAVDCNDPKNVLWCPLSPAMNQDPPVTFTVRFTTELPSRTFDIMIMRDWAPIGAKRFYNLVVNKFLDDTRFYRSIAGFVAQFGVNGDPSVTHAWEDPRAILPNDPIVPGVSNINGTICFGAEYTKDQMAVNRTTELYLNFANNSRLDKHGFTPIGHAESAVDLQAIMDIYTGYGCCEEEGPQCHGPSQEKTLDEGNAYLDANFPKLTRIVSVRIVPSGGGGHNHGDDQVTAAGGRDARPHHHRAVHREHHYRGLRGVDAVEFGAQ